MAADADFNSIGKFALNPRGNLWLKDKNKYGEKLLKKMGWSEGKGLGKHEDGVKENIKLRFKDNNTGVGWKLKPIDIPGNENYDRLLSSLWKNYVPGDVQLNTSIDASLEERSQQFKKRLHYRKFVKGKDTSRYSEKDMQSIFVSKPKEESKKDADCKGVDESQDKFTNSVVNLVDYFAQKIKKRKKTKKIDGNEPLIDSLNNMNSQSSELNFSRDQSSKFKKKKPKKSKNATKESDHTNKISAKHLHETFSLPIPEHDTSKSSKKRKIYDISNSEEETSLIDSSLSNLKSASKGSKKRKLWEEEITENSSLQSEMALADNCLSKPHKKKKKSKKKHSKTCVDENPDNLSTNNSALPSEVSSTDLVNGIFNKKQKVKNVVKLKSCMKGKKRVSFSKLISYKTFDTELAADSMNEEETAAIDQSADSLDVVNKKEKKLNKDQTKIVKQITDFIDTFNKGENNLKDVTPTVKQVAETVDENMNEEKNSALKQVAEAVDENMNEEKNSALEQSIEKKEFSVTKSTTDDKITNPGSDIKFIKKCSKCEKKDIFMHAPKNNHIFYTKPKEDVSNCECNESSSFSYQNISQIFIDIKNNKEEVSSNVPQFVPRSSVYAAWIRKQRPDLPNELDALHENIKSDKYLGTSNLAEIKGYGNWGF